MSNYVAKRFGRLLVINHAREDCASGAAWVCICSCGRIKTFSQCNLKSGNSLSCGCIRKEQLAARSTRHGYARPGKKLLEYHIWCSMIQRCHNPNDKGYKNYGGRGIYVCDRWRHSFPNFLADVGQKPKGKSIDRVNNDGPYAPDNFRWATPKEQAMNSRRYLNSKKRLAK